MLESDGDNADHVCNDSDVDESDNDNGRNVDDHPDDNDRFYVAIASVQVCWRITTSPMVFAMDQAGLQ